MRCSAILLTAGQSQRLGINKLLLPYKTIKSNGIKTNQPVILHSLYTLIQAKIPNIIIVLGYQGKKIQNEIQVSPIYKHKHLKSEIKFIMNKKYKSGMASSISTGMSQIPDNTDAVLICLADKPSIKIKTIIQVISRAKHSRKSIVIPVYWSKEGHPVLFKKKYFTRLHRLFSPEVKLEQDYGARVIINRNLSDISRVKVTDIGIIQDIDTWQDYNRLMIA